MKINGFKSEAPVKGFPMLPAGAYVAGIKNVKIPKKMLDAFGIDSEDFE